MRSWILIISTLGVAFLAWHIGGRLSPDALGMALGVLFGILAGIPMALMMLVAARRRTREEEGDDMPSQGRGGPHYRGAPQAPVIILTGGPPAQYGGQHNYAATNPHALIDGQFRPALPGPTQPASARKYKVVGETEEWLDEFS